METLTFLIGKRIRELRKRKRLSQEEFAHEVGKHYTYIGKIERGEKNISLDSLETMTQILEISLEEFFSTIDPNLKKANPVQVEILETLKKHSLEDQEYIYEIIKTVDKIKRS